MYNIRGKVVSVGDSEGKKCEKSCYKKFFTAFEDEEHMQAYYDQRKGHMVRIYCLILMSKIGYTTRSIALMTYEKVDRK